MTADSPENPLATRFKKGSRVVSANKIKKRYFSASTKRWTGFLFSIIAMEIPPYQMLLPMARRLSVLVPTTKISATRELNRPTAVPRLKSILPRPMRYT